MTQVVVLGGGFAGTAAARELRRLVPEKCRIVLVADRPTFVYRPALPWVLIGQRRAAEIEVPLASRLAARGVEFVQDRVEGVDRQAGTVQLARSAPLPYDYLLVALGAEAHLPWPGAERFTASILWLQPTLAAARSLAEILGPSGRKPHGGGAVVHLVVLAGPGTPFVCAAYETALLLHHYLKHAGYAADPRLHLVTAERAPFEASGPYGSEVVGRWLKRSGIDFQAGRRPAWFEAGRVHFEDGDALAADWVLLFPPVRGPSSLAGVEPLLDPDGFVSVTQSMRSLADERIFAAGDVIGAPGPKTGHLAEHEGRVAARAIARALAGREPRVALDSRLVCLLDGGGFRQGLLVMRRPHPGAGDARTVFAATGAIPRWLKQAFERYYLRWRA